MEKKSYFTPNIKIFYTGSLMLGIDEGSAIEVLSDTYEFDEEAQDDGADGFITNGRGHSTNLW